MRLGYVTLNETARQVIETHLKQGKTLAEIRSDAVGLQREMLQMKMAREQALDPEKLIFMDRGMADSITYYRLAGADTAEPAAAASIYRYRAVFIFDRLPMVTDNVRSEDDAVASEIDRRLEEDYISMGYTPIRLPVIPIAARARLLLEKLGIKV